MPNYWGRPPRYEIWQDLQALAFWVLIIGIVGYLLFPDFFKDVYSRLAGPTKITDTASMDSYTLPVNGIDAGNTAVFPSPDYPTVSQGLYGNEVSSGYWVIFVADGQFRQLAVNSETYTFLLRVIEKDQKADVKNTLILVANGQIKKFVVSDEVYTIITSLATIDARARTG